MTYESEWQISNATSVRPVTAVTPGGLLRQQGQRPAPEQAPAEGGDAATTPSESLQERVARLNSQLAESTSVQFRIDDRVDEVVISVVDRNSGEVLRQIPSEEMLSIAARMNENGINLLNAEI